MVANPISFLYDANPISFLYDHPFFKGRGEIFLLDRPPLMDGEYMKMPMVS